MNEIIKTKTPSEWEPLPRWYSVEESLPQHMETVWMSDGKNYISLGCLFNDGETFCWAESSGYVYIKDGKIISDDAELFDFIPTFWHPLPIPPKI